MSSMKPEVITDPDLLREYLVRNKAEIEHALKTIAEANGAAAVYFGRNDFVLSALLAVNPKKNQIILDVSANAALNERAVRAEETLVIASLNGIKIQFAGGPLSRGTHEGRDAFFARYPAEILRFQCRESFRLSLSVINPRRCILPYRMQNAEAIVTDISASGASISNYQSYFQLAIGDNIPNAKLLFPEEQPLIVGLEVCNVQAIAARPGAARIPRAGCRFFGLKAQEENRLQRYIIRTDRERRLKVLHK